MTGAFGQIWILKFLLLLSHAFFFWMTVLVREAISPSRDMLFFSQFFLIYFFNLIGVYSFRGFDSILSKEYHGTIVSVFAGTIFGSLVAIPFISLLYHPRITKGPMILLAAVTFLSVAFYRIFVSYFFTGRIPTKTVFIIGRRENWESLLTEIKEKMQGKIDIRAFISPSSGTDSFPDPLPGCSIIVADQQIFREDSIARWVKDAESSSKCDLEHMPKIAEELLQKIPLSVALFFHEYYQMVFEMVRPAPPQRVLDLFVAVPGLVIGTLLSLFIVPAIIIDSGFPVFFCQRRIGLNGKSFLIHKFRTMYNRKKKEPAFADEDAGLVTRTGAFLRRFRLDEIPQLWDVLRGAMSIVGPRPEQPEFADQYREQIPFYSFRNKLRPGITGWAQINFKYTSNVNDTKNKLEYDLYYIKNRTFLLDLQVILKTAETMLGMRGAK